MKILILSQWFDPEPTPKGLAFAQALQARGHEVEVITGFPNYPGGRIYSGYRIRLFQVEKIADVRIVRVPLYPSHDGFALKRIMNYITFMMSALFIGGFLTRKPDVIYAYHPPITTGIVAVILSFFKNTPFVYDIQDLWPDTLAATGMLKHVSLLDIIHRTCRWVYQNAIHITVLSHGFKKRLENDGVPSEKITIIHNWCDENQIKLEKDSILERDLNVGERFNIVFAGTMGKAQGLNTVIQAARELQMLEPKVQFVFVGGGVEVEALQNLVKEMQLTNVRFLERRPMSEIGKVLACADVLLVHLKDDPLFEITIPSKTQTYLAVGKPILMAVRGDASLFVQESNGGICCEPENLDALVKTVQKFVQLPPSELQKMGIRGKEYYYDKLSLDKGVRHFEEVFKKVINQKKLTYSILKRGIDVLISIFAIILLSPVMLLTAWFIRQQLGTPVLFTQLRPGLNGKPFKMYKFRTMLDVRNPNGQLLSDAERLTEFGKKLRASSLDELPEFLNVLRGDMSLVGPRPLLLEYLDRYTSSQARRHEVRPGITGWAQVNGRNAISWEEKFKLDVWYIDHWSVFLDFKILWLTAYKVFKREGISAANEITMPKFMGNAESDL